MWNEAGAVTANLRASAALGLGARAWPVCCVGARMLARQNVHVLANGMEVGKMDAQLAARNCWAGRKLRPDVRRPHR
jgi:hypothetical protein